MASATDVDRVMYECGIQVLHPGGLEKSVAMARACGVEEGKLVLDVGAGRGVTSCHLARTYRCKVVGIDTSPAMIESAQERAKKERVKDLVSFRTADAYRLPFEDEQFDVVLIECVTTLLDRTRAFPEFVRVLRAGGRLGDLEMIYQKEPPEEFARKLRETWGGFTTMMLQGWRELFGRHGLGVIEIDDFSDLLANLSEATKRELGLLGRMKLLWKLTLHADLRRSMKEYTRIFNEGVGTFGYAYLVGVKRQIHAG
jgi:SAM-dependent methyltransferase